jgi:transposase
VDFVHESPYILWLMNIVEELEAAGEALTPAVREALARLEAVAALVPVLEERIRELEIRLKLNSTNSSLPPSSDSSSVKRAPKKPTGKKRGGQKGHRGHHRQLIPAERVDAFLEHRPAQCGHCGHSLAGAEEAKPAWVHQVVDLPPVRARVTEHQVRCVRCPGCRKLTRASLPAEVQGRRFGPGVVALATLLNGRYRLSRRETVDLMGRLLDVPPPSLGSTEAFVREASAALRPAYAEARAEVLRSESAGVDETPWKLAGGKQWLWVATALRATLFHLGSGRGSEELRRFLGSRFGGVISSDRWCAYQMYERRQLCWAHLTRNFRKLALRGGKAVPFAERGEAVCEEVFRLWWDLQEGRLDRAQLAKQIAPVQRRLRRMLREGTTKPDRKVAGFCRNVLKLWSALWTFVQEPVELTNNAAERALRPAVLWRKGCFGSQSDDGLRYVERMLTLNATARQQQVHPLDYLVQAILALRSGTIPPTLLPIH